MKKISDIEALRAVAVMGVILHHLPDLYGTTWAPLAGFSRYAAGWFGVDLFFCISGYVIARDLMPKLLAAHTWDRAKPVIITFWIRRIWRLWPAAWCWLAILLICVMSFNQSGAFGTLGANIDATIAAVFNYYNVYFGLRFMVEEIGASHVYWSLSLEEQFYVALPLITLFFRRHIVWILVALIIVQLPSARGMWGMMFRTDALCLGVLLALLESKPSYLSLMQKIRHIPHSMGNILLLCICAAMASLAAQDWMNRQVGLIALLSLALVWLASLDRDLFIGKGLQSRVFLWIGSRSYGLYLAHVPAIFLAHEIFFRWHGPDRQGPEDAGILTLLFLCIGLTSVELVYRMVEMPLRNFGTRQSSSYLQRRQPLL